MTNLTCTQIDNDLVVGTLKQLPEGVVIIAEVGEKAVRYVPERTCHKVVGKYGHRWSCSECDETLLPRYPSTRYPDGIVNYCPNCGAKVVDE